MQYALVSITSNMTLFEKTVIGLLAEGWELVGGVAVTFSVQGFTYSQALSKAS